MVESEAGAVGYGPRCWAVGSGRPPGSVLRHGRTCSDGGAGWGLSDALHGGGLEARAPAWRDGQCVGRPVWKRTGRWAGRRSTCCALARPGGKAQSISPARRLPDGCPRGRARRGRCLRAHRRAGRCVDVRTAGVDARVETRGNLRTEREKIEPLARCGRGLRRSAPRGATPCAGNLAIPERGERRVDHAPRRSGTNYTRPRSCNGRRADCIVEPNVRRHDGHGGRCAEHDRASGAHGQWHRNGGLV